MTVPMGHPMNSKELRFQLVRAFKTEDPKRMAAWMDVKFNPTLSKTIPHFMLDKLTTHSIRSTRKMFEPFLVQVFLYLVTLTS